MTQKRIQNQPSLTEIITSDDMKLFDQVVSDVDVVYSGQDMSDPEIYSLYINNILSRYNFERHNPDKVCVGKYQDRSGEIISMSKCKSCVGYNHGCNDYQVKRGV